MSFIGSLTMLLDGVVKDFASSDILMKETGDWRGVQDRSNCQVYSSGSWAQLKWIWTNMLKDRATDIRWVW